MYCTAEHNLPIQAENWQSIRGGVGALQWPANRVACERFCAAVYDHSLDRVVAADIPQIPEENAQNPKDLASHGTPLHLAAGIGNRLEDDKKSY